MEKIIELNQNSHYRKYEKVIGSIIYLVIITFATILVYEVAGLALIGIASKGFIN